jgi:hypothetical protein
VSHSDFFGRTWPRLRGGSYAASHPPARGPLPGLACVAACRPDRLPPGGSCVMPGSRRQAAWRRRGRALAPLQPAGRCGLRLRDAAVARRADAEQPGVVLEPWPAHVVDLGARRGPAQAAGGVACQDARPGPRPPSRHGPAPAGRVGRTGARVRAAWPGAGHPRTGRHPLPPYRRRGGGTHVERSGCPLGRGRRQGPCGGAASRIGRCAGGGRSWVTRTVGHATVMAGVRGTVMLMAGGCGRVMATTCSRSTRGGAAVTA